MEAEELHRRERQAFGGTIQWEAAFFGLLAGAGMTTLLIAMAIGLMFAVGVIDEGDGAADLVDQVSAGGGVILAVSMLLGALTGGYVAGRMARFDGWRQGLGIWLLSALILLAFVVVAWIAGGEINPVSSISLPEDPIDEGPLSNGWTVAAAGAALGLLAAIAGGIIGERFHREVDRAGLESPEEEPSQDEEPSEPETVDAAERDEEPEEPASDEEPEAQRSIGTGAGSSVPSGT